MALADVVNQVFGSGWSFVRGFTSTHHGVDIAAGQGQDIPALAGGTVVFSGFAGGGGQGYVNGYSPPSNPTDAAKFQATGGGNVVVVQGTDGLFYQYAHLNWADVHVGDTVQRGTTIGQVGHTGDATGNHLHFAIFDPTKHTFIDPTPFLESIGGHVGTGAPATAGGNVFDDIGKSIASVGYFIGIIFVGMTILLVAALVSRNNAQGSS